MCVCKVLKYSGYNFFIRYNFTNIFSVMACLFIFIVPCIEKFLMKSILLICSFTVVPLESDLKIFAKSRVVEIYS